MKNSDESISSSSYLQSSSVWHVGLSSFDKKTKKFGSRLIESQDDDYQYDHDYLQMEVVGKDVERGCVKKQNGNQRSSLEIEDKNLYKSCQKSRNVIEKIIEEYINGFSLHGLTKIFVAHTRLESLFWLIALLSGIMLSMYVSTNLVNKYLRFEVYTETKLEITDKNYFPAVTICERQLLLDFYSAYCKFEPNNSVPCQHKKQKIEDNHSTTDNKTWWSNGLFNITKCSSWGAKQCANNDFLFSLSQYNHTCIRWNYNGDLYDMYGHVDIEFTINNSLLLPYHEPNIILMSHDPLIFEIDITNAVNLEAKQYNINLEKTFIERLPFPFPSKCTDSKNNDMFSGKYTRRSCLETQNYIGMYIECGDTIDYIRQYIPNDILQKYKKLDTILNIGNCIDLYSHKEVNPLSKNCPFSCTEYQINMLVSSREYFKNDNRITSETYSVGIQYITVDSYRIIKEKQLYSIHQMACEIGGLIGLMVGCSLLSAIEIIVCSVLWLVVKFKKVILRIN
ncbi:uncharacterized protein LOC124809911 [Hydra vulgaris]|uniref:Uncharacterized protein LOC124809911 n=1 Tax=Hydra vulgaris TaxID=6087 RepID=A0ABM4B8C1_HYDVU